MKILKEQQKKNKRAVVLTDSIHNVNKLIERIAMSGEKVINVDVKRPIDVAIDILNTYNARKGKMIPIVEPNIEVGSIFIDEIIRDKKNGITFCPKESLCKKTCIEILNNINLIRLNKATDEYEKTKEKKILEIKELVKLYERKLEENELYDETRILTEATELYKKDKSLFDINLEYYQILFNEEQNLRTKEFINAVFVDKLIKLDNEFTNGKNKVIFKKYYGMFTEVYNTLDDIIKKNLKFGDVEIMYTSTDYIPYLKSIFGENKVKINFVSGYSALSNNYVKLFYDMLNFAKNGFIYEEFKKVCFNKLIKIKDVQYLFLGAIRKGLNFDIEQFKNFIKNVDAVKDEKNDENGLFDYKAEYVEFLREIVKVFDDKLANAHKIYEGVLDILDKWTFECKEKRDGREKLHAMRDTIKFIKNPENIDEMLDAILDETNRLIFNDAEENNAITVDLFDGYKVINRKNVYVLGLSSKHYNIKTIESPVLSDEERKIYLDNRASYIELNSDKPINSEKKILNTLRSFDNANVTISMTYFDILEHMELAESTLYSSLLDMHGNPQVLSIDKYPNIIENDYKFDKKRFFNEKIEKLKDGVKEEKENDEENVNELKEANEEKSKFDNSGYTDKKAKVIEKYFSPSSLDKFKSCPLDYHYTKEAKIQEEEYVLPSDSEWLNAADKGTFVHRIFELYIKACFIGKGTKVDKKINEKEFAEAVRIAEIEITAIHPVDSINMARSVIDYCTKKARQYLENLHKEISDNNKWGIIDTEHHFGAYSTDEFTKEYKIKDKTFKIHYNGYMDRVDGYTDENGIEHIRIIDYKTGRLDKEKYDNSTQQHIYSEYFKSKKKIVDEFIYEFVFDETDSDHRLVYKDEDLADPIEKFELEELLYDVFVDGKYLTEGLAYDPNGGCKWCEYKDICLVRIKENA